MPLTSAEAARLKAAPIKELVKLLDRQWARMLEGLEEADKAKPAPGAWLRAGVQAASKDVGAALEQGAKLETSEPQKARQVLSDAYRKARQWAEIVEIPVNLARFIADLDEQRTKIDGDRWKPYDQQIARIKVYLTSGRPGDFGSTATHDSIARLIRVSLPAALQEELGRNGGSYALAWTSFAESAAELAEAVKEGAKEVGRTLKSGADSLIWLLFGGAALLAAWEYSKRGRRRG